MSHHNKYYSVYSTGSGYKYEVTESFDDGDFVSISKELSEADLKAKCYPLLAGIYDSLALHTARLIELTDNSSDFDTELTSSGITNTYDTWASSSFISHYSGSYVVTLSGSTWVHENEVDMASNVTNNGTSAGSIDIVSTRMFNYVTGSTIPMYSDDGVHYVSANGLLEWVKR